MEALLLVVSLITAAFSVPVEVQWLQWKELHGRIYTLETEQVRKDIWFDNHRYIERHNNEGYSYKLGLNEFVDMVRKRTPSYANNYYTCLFFHSVT